MSPTGTGRTVTTQDAILSEVVHRLVSILEPQRIYLFGSRARGEATEDSDYDLLAVVQHSDQPRHRRAQVVYKSLFGFRVPLDVIVLTRAEFERELPVVASLSATAAREGHLLYAAT